MEAPSKPEETRISALLWLNEAETYAQALKRAGFGTRLDIQLLRSDQQPSHAQLARTGILLARVAPPGLLARMPKLRWSHWSIANGVIEMPASE